MTPRYTVLTKAVFAVCAAVFAVQAYRAATAAIRPDEAYLYDRFVRPTARQIWQQELPNRDVLFTFLEKRTVGMLHVSPFSVRAPGLLFLALYLWSSWQLARSLSDREWIDLGLVSVAAGACLWWGWFSYATGIGAAIALQLCAVRYAIQYLKRNDTVTPGNLNLSGCSLGLSVAARWEFAAPAVAVAFILLIVLLWQRKLSLWVDRVLISAIVAALIPLVLPLSHAHAAPEWVAGLDADKSAELQSALDVLRASAGTLPVRIGASAAAEPVANFYRAQHRLVAWSRVDRLGLGGFDYYLLDRSDEAYVQQRHLIVLARDADFVVARKTP
jgi:hypothetical protein